VGYLDLGEAWLGVLNYVSATDIETCREQQLSTKTDPGKEIHEKSAANLPLLDWDKFVEISKKGRCLIVISGVVHDVTYFILEHPSGLGLLCDSVGKDATSLFHRVYNHLHHANDLLVSFQIGLIQGGGEVKKGQ
jgi:stearoyl-CoA desaturase (delta-9 desaturase)